MPAVDPIPVTLITQKYNPSVAAYTTTLREFVQQQQQGAEAVQKQMAAERMLTVKIAAVAVGLLLLAIIVGAYYLIGSIQRPLEQANGLAERIAGGDLSMQESVTRGDEFGDLLRSLYAMSSALGRMVHQVRQSTDSIAIASAEIATGNHDLSARTEQTSSNLQETAAAMEQFTSTIQQSAGSAQQASSLAAGATGVAACANSVGTTRPSGRKPTPSAASYATNPSAPAISTAARYAGISSTLGRSNCHAARRQALACCKGVVRPASLKRSSNRSANSTKRRFLPSARACSNSRMASSAAKLSGSGRAWRSGSKR